MDNNIIDQNEQIIWQRFLSPQNIFTIYIPKGWKYISITKEESQIAFSPIKNIEPQIGILTSYFKNKMPMSAYDYLPYMTVLFKKSHPGMEISYSDLRLESIDIKSESNAEIVHSFNKYNMDLLEIDNVYIQKVKDVTFGGYHIFAIISYLISLRENFSNLRYLAAQLIGSFYPNENWLSQIKDDIANGLMQRLQLTNTMMTEILSSTNSNYKTIRTIDLMHYSLYNQILSDILNMLDIKKLFWIHFLKLTKYMKDPITGAIYDVDNRYNHYYINSMDDIIGSKNPIKDHNLNELESLNPDIY